MTQKLSTCYIFQDLTTILRTTEMQKSQICCLPNLEKSFWKASSGDGVGKVGPHVTPLMLIEHVGPITDLMALPKLIKMILPKLVSPIISFIWLPLWCTRYPNTLLIQKNGTCAKRLFLQCLQMRCEKLTWKMEKDEFRKKFKF